MRMNICVYGASSNDLQGGYYAAAEELGELIASGGHRLVFGGGSGGLMGACARGAARRGGEIIGIAPRFFDEPGVLFTECTRFVFTDTMRERKQAMEDESEAFIVLPGGIGTFEEFFEMLTLKQIGRHSKHMAVLNTLGYYEAMRKMLETAADGGFMSQDCMELFAFCETPAAAMEQLKSAKITTGSMTDYNKRAAAAANFAAGIEISDKI